MSKCLSKEINDFSTLICRIDKDTEKNIVFQDIGSYFESNPIDDDGIKGRVWILIGKQDESSPFVSLMVAQSENIEKEIYDDVKAMYNAELDNLKSPRESKKSLNGNTFFYEEGARFKNQYLYRLLKKQYSILEIYEVDIDRYLEKPHELHQFERISYELSKDYLAESKLAIETNSMYWNYYRSGVGKRAYIYFKTLKDDFER